MREQIDYKKFGQIISGIRREKRLSQQHVCDDLNISTSYYSDIENGNVNPSIDILWQLLIIMILHCQILC